MFQEWQEVHFFDKLFEGVWSSVKVDSESIEIFLAYAEQDEEFATRLVGVFEEHGWVVYAQSPPITPEEEDRAEFAFDAAGCVLILWTSYSRSSEWIRSVVAESSHNDGRLVSLSVGDTNPPLKFRGSNFSISPSGTLTQLEKLFDKMSDTLEVDIKTRVEAASLNDSLSIRVAKRVMEELTKTGVLRDTLSVENETFYLGEWIADPSVNGITDPDGEVHKLRPKSMDVLKQLNGNIDQVVSIADLLSTVWEGRVVGYETVYMSIAELRRVFASRGDGMSDFAPEIETIKKRGYVLHKPKRP